MLGLANYVPIKTVKEMPAIIEEAIVTTTPHVELSGCAAPSENYAPTTVQRGPSVATSQDISGALPPEADVPKSQQPVIAPSIARVSSLTCQLQAQDVEMRDNSHSLDPCKRGVKKDGVSKSCPPSLRTGSPRLHSRRIESQER